MLSSPKINSSAFRLIMNKARANKKYPAISADDFVIFCQPGFKLPLVRDGERKENWRAQRKKRMQFHIAQGDYFGTLATILGLLAEDKSYNKKELFKKCADDLMYLQKQYKIIKK